MVETDLTVYHAAHNEEGGDDQDGHNEGDDDRYDGKGGSVLVANGVERIFEGNNCQGTEGVEST